MNNNTLLTPGGVSGQHNEVHSVVTHASGPILPALPQAHAYEQETVGGQLVHDTGTIDTSALISVEEQTSRGLNQTMPIHPLEDMLTRFVRVKTYTLSSAASPLTILDNFDPWALYQENPAVAAKLSNYYLIRADLEVLIVSAFPPASYGAWEATALPYGGQQALAANVMGSPNPLQCRAADVHAEILATAGNDVCLTLPFFWPFDYAALRSSASAFAQTGLAKSWTVFITNLAPLATAIPGGVASGALTVYVRMKPGYTLTIPTLQSKKLSVSGVLNSVSSGLTSLSGVPMLGDYARAGAASATIASTVASALGYSRAPEDVRPVPVQAVSFPPLSHAAGKTLVNEANLLPGIYLKPELDSGVDIASFEDLARRSFIPTVLTWSASQTAGTSLTTMPLTPFLMVPIAAASPEHSISAAGFVGLPFGFWRADAVVEVEVVCSSFHRGTLQAYWTPWNYTAVPTDDPTNIAVNHIWDIQPGLRKQFRIGYARANPYATVVPLVQSQIASGTTLDTICNGFFSLRVVNALQTQVANASVSLIITTRWENVDYRQLPMFLETPAIGSTPTVVANPFQTYASLQGMGDADISGEDINDLIPATRRFPGDDLCFPGLGVASCRAMVQKPTMLFQLQLKPLSTNGAQLVGMTIPFPLNSNSLGPYMANEGIIMGGNSTYAEWYTSMFCWAGSIVIQAYSPSSSLVGAESGYPSNAAKFEIPGPMNALVMTAATGGYQVQLPYMNTAKFVFANNMPAIGIQTATSVYKAAIGNATVDTSLALHYSLADDVRFTRFVQVPYVHFNQTSFPTEVSPFF